MPENATCARCGQPLDAELPGRLCSACALTLAIEVGDVPATQSATEPIGAAAPPPATVVVPPAEGPGTVIGRYKLLQKIGEGGCGVVYMAEQEEPVHRRVALKVIKLGMDTKEVIARFEAERQALALMDHPNIAKVFDAGSTETGRPYFVMELVRGIRITQFCDQHNLSTRERLDLFTKICQAIQHAHQKGIIHRDIKPSNVMVASHDGVPVPKVIDFGIAKATAGRLTDKTLFTAFEQFIGTPAYMSPEQAELSGLDIDTRTDIYSLGVLLYELLTGRPPFDPRELAQAGLDEIRRIIREEEPPKPSTRLTSELVAADVRRRTSKSEVRTPKSEEDSASSRRRLQELIHLLRGDLDWIVMKCLEKDRARRYDTANGLAMDLGRHLRLEPVLASPPSKLYRFQKFVRRNKAVVSAAATIAVVLVLGVVTSTWQWRSAVQARSGEEQQRRAAETNAVGRREQLVRLDVANGVRAMDNGDWFGALLWFTEALRQDQPGTRAEEMHRYRIGALLNYSPRLTQMWFQQGTINQVAFSPDGRWALTAAYDHTARLWDVQTGAAGAVFPHGTNVSQAAFSADGHRVLTLSDDGSVRVWDPATGQLVCPPLAPGYRVTHARIGPDGRRVFTAGNPGETNLTENGRMQSWGEKQEGEVRIWDATTGRPVRLPFRRKTQGGQQLALGPDGQWLAASFGESLLVWNLRQPQALHLVGGGEPQATLLPSLNADPTSRDIEALLPEVPPLRKSRGGEPAPPVAALAFSPDNQRLVAAYGDGAVLVWPLRVPGAHGSGSSMGPVPAATPLVLQRPNLRPVSPFGFWPRLATFRGAAFSPDGQRVVLVDGDGVVRLWNARTAAAEGVLKGKAGSQVGFSPDGRLVLLSAQVWDTELDEAFSPGPLQPDIRSAAFSPNGRNLLAGSGDGTVRLWNLAGGVPPLPPFKHDKASVAAQRAVSEENAGVIGTDQREQVTIHPFGEVRHAAFSADGRRVVTVSGGLARVWDAANGQAVTPFVTLNCRLESAAFSPDGTRFVTVGSQLPEQAGLARVWDARMGQPLTPNIRFSASWPGHSADFSPDGRWLITQSEDATRLWNAQTGEPGELPMRLNGPIRSFALSADGHLVAVCWTRTLPLRGAKERGEGVVAYQTRVWNVQTGQPATPPLPETNEVTRVEFSPDGRWLLTFARTPLNRPGVGRSYSHSTRLWLTAGGRLVTRPLRAADPSGKAIFSDDGRCLFLFSFLGDLIAWDLPGERALDAAQWRGLKLRPHDVTTDGRRVANGRGREARVYDAVTGEPLTPVLRQDWDLNFAGLNFSPDGSLLLAKCGERAQLWPLPKETRPVEELVLLARLLSGRQIDAFGNDVEWSPTAAADAWQTLRSKFPASFAVAPEQARVWRERMVEACERTESWSAAVLHLDQLVKENPTDETLRLRRARARDRAAMEELR